MTIKTKWIPHKQYKISMNISDELILDIDDLIGIIQQLDALSQGYDAMDFSCKVIEEYIWQKK